MHLLELVVAKTPNLMYRLNVQVTAYGRQTISDRGVVRSCDPLKIMWAPIISLELLNLKSSNFVHR